MNLLEEFCLRHEPQIDNPGEALYNAFGEGQIKHVYAALCFKHKIPTSPYRDTMKEFLANHEPSLLCAVDVVCYLNEGREAEFSDYIVNQLLGRRISTKRTWIKVEPAAGEPFYYSALSDISQRENPIGNKKGLIGTVKDVKFSSVPPEDAQGGANPTVSEARSTSFGVAGAAAVTAFAIRNFPQRLTEIEQQLSTSANREFTLLFALHETWENNAAIQKRRAAKHD